MGKGTIRLLGLAAIVAGILRGLTSLVPGTTPHVLLLYLVVDVFLLFGSIGLCRFQREEIRWPGTLGFLLQMVGILILIGRDLAIFGAGLYPAGALMFAVGLDLLAVSSWRAKKFPRWILLFLIVSTIVGPIGFFVRGLGVLFVVSGVVFGIGFAGAGAIVLFSRRELFQPAGSEHG